MDRIQICPVSENWNMRQGHFMSGYLRPESFTPLSTYCLSLKQAKFQAMREIIYQSC